MLRARTGAHEVITTIMLNSIALFLTRWLINSTDPVILRDRSGQRAAHEDHHVDGAAAGAGRAPSPRLHAGLIVMLLLCVVVAFVLRRTTFGFETITVGTNPHAAHYAGISVSKIIILAMVLSGGFAGLAAVSEVAGTNSFFQPGTFALLGFDGIAIALLARANPIAIIPAAFLWGSLLAGAPLMQQEADVSIDVVRIIQSMVLLFVAADAIVRYIFRIRGPGPAEARRPRRRLGWTMSEPARPIPTTLGTGLTGELREEHAPRTTARPPPDRRHHLRRRRRPAAGRGGAEHQTTTGATSPSSRRPIRSRSSSRPCVVVAVIGVIYVVVGALSFLPAPVRPRSR